MSLRRCRFALVLAVTILLAASHAYAITLTLAGPDPGSVAPAVDLTSTLWAGVPDAPIVKITTLGARAPGGGTFTDIGVPAIAPNNQVIFGAEVTDDAGVARWDIFRGDSSAPSDRRVVRALDSSAASPGCVPKLKLDPYPVAGSNGAIAFIAPEATGSDSLFYYSEGELTCAARVGARTAQGHLLKMIFFGSAAMAPSGEVAFKGRIEDGDSPRSPGAHRSSHIAMMLAAPHQPIHEIAVEGSREPRGARFASFGLPAVVSTAHGAMVAFTATTRRGSQAPGYGLYVFRGGKTVEVLASGDRTSVGRISFLSNGRPALSTGGSIAVRGASADRRAIVAIRDGRPIPVLTPGHVTEVGSRIVTFGDPVVSASGRIVLGIIDDDGRNLLYAVNPGNVMRISTAASADGDLVGGLATPVFAGTLVGNEAGAFAFLGGK